VHQQAGAVCEVINMRCAAESSKRSCGLRTPSVGAPGAAALTAAAAADAWVECLQHRGCSLCMILCMQQHSCSSSCGSSICTGAPRGLFVRAKDSRSCPKWRALAASQEAVLRCNLSDRPLTDGGLRPGAATIHAVIAGLLGRGTWIQWSNGQHMRMFQSDGSSQASSDTHRANDDFVGFWQQLVIHFNPAIENSREEAAPAQVLHCNSGYRHQTKARGTQ